MIDLEQKKRLSIKFLADEILKNKLAIFVGAGCSVASGLPTWKEMIQNICDEYNLKTNVSDLMRLASMLEKKNGSAKFRELIVKSVQSHPYWKVCYTKNLLLLT